MKRLSTTAVLAALLVTLPTGSHAQVYGQFTGAEPVPMAGHLFGGYLHVSEDFLGVLAQLRLSFYPDVDFGFQGGLTRVEVGSSDFTTLKVGGDLRFHVLKANPVDLSVGGALGVETGDDISVLTLGPTAVASHTFGVGTRGGVTPYAGLGLLFSNADVLGRESTDFSIPFRLGTEFQLSPELRLTGEVQLRASDEFNDDFSFVTGVNLPF